MCKCIYMQNRVRGKIEDWSLKNLFTHIHDTCNVWQSVVHQEYTPICHLPLCLPFLGKVSLFFSTQVQATIKATTKTCTMFWTSSRWQVWGRTKLEPQLKSKSGSKPEPGPELDHNPKFEHEAQPHPRGQPRAECSWNRVKAKGNVGSCGVGRKGGSGHELIK